LKSRGQTRAVSRQLRVRVTRHGRDSIGLDYAVIFAGRLCLASARSTILGVGAAMFTLDRQPPSGRTAYPELDLD
jgi:hypothetical protein